MNGKQRQRGFTLIELMVAVAIIGVLAALAYPSYTEHVRKGRRADAQAALMELAQQLERHYTLHNSYAAATLASAVIDRVSAYYTITLSAQQAQSFTLEAKPTSRQSADPCGPMTLDHTGATTALTSGCWK